MVQKEKYIWALYLRNLSWDKLIKTVAGMKQELELMRPVWSITDPRQLVGKEAQLKYAEELMLNR